jgi:hypothetical protein
MLGLSEDPDGSEPNMDVRNDDYAGDATLLVGEQQLPVRVRLRGHLQPIDGRFHWYGRLDADEAVRAAAGRTSISVTLRTPTGEATGTLGDPDPSGRYRVTGTGRPPYPVDLTDV